MAMQIRDKSGGTAHNAKDEIVFTQMRNGAYMAHFAELKLHSAFQPIFALEDEKLRPMACEGLLRVTTSSDRVATGSFLSSLDPTQRLEVEEAARRLHLHNASLLAPKLRRVFLNFNPSILGAYSTHEHMIDQLGKQVKAGGLSPADVVCELTEQTITDTDLMKHFVYALRARGYLIAVDDFGARASNAKRVSDVVPDIVKFDSRLTQRLLQSPQSLATLVAMIRRFHDDGIRVVLEGIQKSWHIPLAIRSGADFYQGFALAVPRLAPAQFSEWFAPDQARAG